MDVFINQERFSAADVQVFWLGRAITGFRKITFKEEQSVEGVKVVGNREDGGFVRGNLKKNASINLLQEEIEGIIIANGGGSLLTVPASNMTIVMKKGPLLLKKTVVCVIPLASGLEAEAGNTTALGMEIPLYIGQVLNN